MKEKWSTSQVLSPRPSVQQLLQLMQDAACRSCVRACQLFCLPLPSLLGDRASCCSDKTPQSKEDENIQERLWAPSSTVLIVNISNSTLIDCVIGDSYPSAVAERQPLAQDFDLQKHTQERCSCSHGQQGAAQTAPPPPPPPAPPACPAHPSGECVNVNIQSSRLNCVIIGDNNHMHAEQSQPFD